MKKRANTINSCIAGEALVLSYLSKNGLVGVLTYKNTPSFDLIACDEQGEQFAAIQIKANKDKNTFMVGNKIECRSDNVWWAFVTLSNSSILWAKGSEVANQPFQKEDGSPQKAKYLTMKQVTSFAKEDRIMKELFTLSPMDSRLR